MRRSLLILTGYLLTFAVIAQNKPPVAVNDTVEVIAQVPTLIDALANDYDPDGDTISINNWFNYHQSGIDTLNGKFLYNAKHLSGNNFYDYFDYRIRDVDQPSLISDPARVIIHVSVNPHAPVAIPDTVDLLELEPLMVDVLANDIDSEGDDLKIENIYSKESCSVVLNNDSSSLTVTPHFSQDMTASFSYRVVERNTPERLRSFSVRVDINILPNPDIPVITPDTAYATGGVPLFIPLMENDFDPQGDEIEFKNVSNPAGCQVEIQDDGVIFTSPGGFEGEVTFSYTIQEVLDPVIYSNYAWVTVFVTKNPGCPVGMPDLASGTTAIPLTINLLANDYDPDGDPLEILDVESEGDVTIDGHSIIFTSDPLKIGHDTLMYRVSQVNNSTFYSDWTPVIIELATNPDLPVAVEDNYLVNGSIPMVINPLINDIRNAADTLVLMGAYSSNSRITQISDSTFEYQANRNFSGPDVVKYGIRDKSNIELRAFGYIYVDILNQHFYDSLTINNISAGVSGDGMLFTKYNGYADVGARSELYNLHFRYPKESNTHTIFNSILWMGGLAEDDSIHFAGEMYRQIGNDFQPGPISNIYDSIYAEKFWKIWKLSKAEVEFHRNNWWKAGYEPIYDIARWPGNGDITSGQAAQLAPYTDYDQDGFYNPMNGDFPLIRGDQSVFFIYNDDREHTEMLGNPIKAEIHGMVYGFDEPSDSALWNTVFVHYDIYNRSEDNYHDFYIGLFTDLDLGNFWDDYIGSDVSRSSYYVYNGQDFDPDITSFEQSVYGYGAYPPAQSVTVLAGPYLEPDGIDNPQGDCDFSANGINFGNGIADDERMGLCHFIYFMSDFFWNMYPYYPEDCHDLMKGIWQDGSKCFYGGNGHMYFNETSVGPTCNFMFPGDSDTLNWGTNCVLPNGGYNQNGFYWTDSSTTEPGDRRGLGTIGPLIFKPGERLELEVAYCAANGWNGPVSSIVQLMENIDSLRARVSRGEIIIPDNSLNVSENVPAPRNLKIYPNPAGNSIHVKIPDNVSGKADYVVYSILGNIAASGHTAGNSLLKIDISGFMPGFYIVIIRLEEGIYSGRFVKI